MLGKVCTLLAVLSSRVWQVHSVSPKGSLGKAGAPTAGSRVGQEPGGPGQQRQWPPIATVQPGVGAAEMKT